MILILTYFTTTTGAHLSISHWIWILVHYCVSSSVFQNSLVRVLLQLPLLQQIVYALENGPYCKLKYWTQSRWIGKITRKNKASHICSPCPVRCKVCIIFYWVESGNYRARTARVSTTAGAKGMKILFISLNSELITIFLLVTSDRHQYFYLLLPKITWNRLVHRQHFDPCCEMRLALDPSWRNGAQWALVWFIYRIKLQ